MSLPVMAPSHGSFNTHFPEGVLFGMQTPLIDMIPSTLAIKTLPSRAIPACYARYW